MAEYIRLSEDYNNNTLIPVSESPYKFIKSQKPYFISMMKYNEEQYKQWQKTRSLAGMTGGTTNKIWADFDSEGDIKAAFNDGAKFVDRLLAQGFKEENLQISFSGNKGIGVIIETEQEFTIDEVKAFCTQHSQDLQTFDTVMYDHQRIFRLMFSRNEKTGLYKIPLTLEELRAADVNAVKEVAKDPSNFDQAAVTSWYKKATNKIKIEVPKPVLKLASPPTTAMDIGDLKPPYGWKEFKWAIAEGFFESGERHQALMVLAATCRGLGYDRTTAYHICKSAIEKQAQRTGTDKFAKEELYTNIIEKSVYSDKWQGGQFSPKTNPWLADYCKRMGFETDQDDEPVKIIGLDQIEDDFTHFVKHIGENTILTGIPRLDKAMPLTTGMNLGIVGAASSGKCLGKDTPVLMYDGSVKMVQDIKAGELLMGDDSSPRTVLTTCKGSETLYKVHQSNGDDYIVNESHILSLQCGLEKSDKFRKHKIVDIPVTDYLAESNRFKRYFKGYKVGVEFQEKETLLDPYFLGIWLGDGDKNEPRVTNNDKEIQDYVIGYGGKLGLGYNRHQDTRTGAVTIRLSNGATGGIENPLMYRMRQEKLEGNKHIPQHYLTNSRSNRLKLLAGLIDSDGHWSASNHYELTMKDKNLVDNITFLCRSLGFKTTVKSKIGHCMYKGAKREAEYFRMYINGENLTDIPVLLERKKAKNAIRKVLSTVIKLEKLGVGDYYGFEIDGNHRFLLGDFTVTHNTALALDILKNTSKAGVVSVFASLDMHRNRLFEKLLYKTTGLSREALYREFAEGRGGAITAEIKKDYGNVFFYDRSCPTVADIRAYIKNVEEQTGKRVKLVMLDYFERVGASRSDDTAASKEVSGQLQDLVNDFNVCLVTLVQPNKFSLGGGPDSPITSYTAIKGSSFLYQSFRSIISIWRPFFTPELKNNDKFMQMAILKNDLGELDLFNFSWSGKRGEILELSSEGEDELQRLLDAKEARKNMKKEESGNGWDG